MTELDKRHRSSVYDSMVKSPTPSNGTGVLLKGLFQMAHQSFPKRICHPFFVV